MLSDRENILFQSKEHTLIRFNKFRTIEEYCLYLIHMKAYEEASRISAGKFVLDLGCNTGFGTEMISHFCREVKGADVSLKAIQEARKMFGANGINFEHIDGIQLPYKDNVFDLVLSFQVIEHIVDYNSYLSEINRVLVPGGKVLLTTPNALLRLDPGMKPWNPFHIREFCAGELEELLRDYFPKVKIRGMLAKESLYSIETKRLKMALEGARRKTKLFYSWRRECTNAIPDSIKRLIATMVAFLKTEKNRKIPQLEESVIAQYSTRDLYYCDDNLDRSLELMAICDRGE